jgi:hypothetical protein
MLNLLRVPINRGFSITPEPLPSTELANKLVKPHNPNAILRLSKDGT